MNLEEVYWPELGRSLYARPGTSDRRVIEDCFPGYHLPPSSLLSPYSILDVGANIGATSLHYQHLWPGAKVVSVEPDPETQKVLVRNIGGGATRGKPYMRTVAVSAEMGKQRWRTRDLNADAFRLDPAGDAEVHCVTLEHAVGYDFGDQVDFVKLDAEGEEWNLFAHGDRWPSMIRHLLVELHYWGAPPPPPEPWPEGRDGPNGLLASAILMLEGLGFVAVPHTIHPHSIWATQ